MKETDLNDYLSQLHKVQAIQFDGFNIREVTKFTGENRYSVYCTFNTQFSQTVNDCELIAHPTDWIIRIDSDLFVVSDKAFQLMYAPRP